MVENNDLKKIKQLLDVVENSVYQIKDILFLNEVNHKIKNLNADDSKETIEGVFDGESMIGPNNKKYPVPANYASKSKLIPGDILKLTVLDDGGFVFKQIGPIERKKIIGTLEEISDGRFIVNVKNKKYFVLLASVTYFKAKEGDEVTIVVPKDGESEWAAIENLLERKE